MSRTMLGNAALMVRLSIFIRVSNRIFLEFFVRGSSFSTIKPFDYRGSTVLGKGSKGTLHREDAAVMFVQKFVTPVQN
jgi:hypothetical protein